MDSHAGGGGGRRGGVNQVGRFKTLCRIVSERRSVGVSGAVSFYVC